MIKQHKQTLRTFFHSLALAVLTAVIVAIGGHRTWAAGFAIGAALSLFSLVSLKFCVPMLFYPGASRRAVALLHVTLLMKLPIYCVGLYLASRLGNSGSFAAFIGCTLVPCVITVEAVGKALVESNRNL